MLPPHFPSFRPFNLRFHPFHRNLKRNPLHNSLAPLPHHSLSRPKMVRFRLGKSDLREEPWFKLRQKSFAKPNYLDNNT
jgi:hypothetical protein